MVLREIKVLRKMLEKKARAAQKRGRAAVKNIGAQGGKAFKRHEKMCFRVFLREVDGKEKG